MPPRTPGPHIASRPHASGLGEDVICALTSLETRFPAAVIWFGRSTRHWWAVAGAGCRAQLLEGESPSALTTALARFDMADRPARGETRGPALTRPQKVLRAGQAPYGGRSAAGMPGDVRSP